jgi:hypothetical protein
MRVRGMLKGGVHQRFQDVFITVLKEGFVQWSLKTVSILSLSRKLLFIQVYLSSPAYGPR